MKSYIPIIAVALSFTFNSNAYAQNFSIHENGITILCKNAELGDTGTVNGIEYTKRSKDQITVDNASTSCVSGETDFSFMFEGDSIFNEDITHWDVSNAINMQNMFSGSAFNQPIGNWNVSSVTDMDKMFQNASSFNQDLNEWCLLLIKTTPDNFSLNSGLEETNIPLWGTCAGFAIADNEVTITCEAADVGDSVELNGITYTKRTVDQITIENASTTCTSGITDMIGLFEAEYTFNEDISHWDVSNVSTTGRVCEKLERSFVGYDLRGYY